MKCSRCGNTDLFKKCPTCFGVESLLPEYLKSPQGRLYIMKELSKVQLPGAMKDMVTHHYLSVSHPGEENAGIPSYHDTINLFFTYGNPPELAEQFQAEFLKLVEQFFGSKATGSMTHKTEEGWEG